MKWYGKHESINEELINNIGIELGVSFPNDYITIAKENHGGSPELEVLDIPSRKECVFDRLLCYDGEKNTILHTMKLLSDRLPAKLIPFATDPFGNYYCFDFNENQSQIILWNHETGNTEFVSHTFTEMMDMLYIPS